MQQAFGCAAVARGHAAVGQGQVHVDLSVALGQDLADGVFRVDEAFAGVEVGAHAPVDAGVDDPHAGLEIGHMNIFKHKLLVTVFRGA